MRHAHALLAALLLAGAADAATLELGTVRAPAGQIAWLPITLAAGDDVLGAQLDLVVPAAAQVATADGKPLCVANPAVRRNWLQAGYVPAWPVVCTPGADCEAIRVLTLDLSEAIRDPLPVGAVLAHCAVRAPAAGALAIGCRGARVGTTAVLADQLAEGEDAVCTPGAVEAVAGCAVGDLDASGTITVDEVIGAIEAALDGCR